MSRIALIPNSSDIVTITSILSTADVAYKAIGVNLLVMGQTLVVPAVSSMSFIPTRVLIELTAVTGTLTVPIIRIGNNGTFDNVAPLFTCTGIAAARDMLLVPLVAALKSLNISLTGISVDIQTAGLVASVATANIYVFGLLR